MSLVPSRKAVQIRRVNETSVVVYNPIGNEVVVVENEVAKPRRRRNNGYKRRNYCPHCGRGMEEEEHRRDYFMILDEYNRATPAPSGEPSRAASPAFPSADEGISSVAFSQGYYQRFFQELGLLGRGSRAAVYHVEHVLEGVSIGTYALKKIPVGYNQAWLHKVLAEVNLLRQLTHPNLIRYNHVWLEVTALSDFGPPVPCAYLLQEYCNGGTLEDYVNSHGPLSASEIRDFIGDITAGVQHLHSQGLIHCDLKPSNCLIQESDHHRPVILVSDFGESQVEGSRRAGTGSTGTLEYCAPEVLVKEGNYPPFSRASDMFSLGMTLYFLCFGKLPYNNKWMEEQDVDLLLQQVRKFEFKDSESLRPDLAEFLPTLKELLSCPSERPTAEEVLVRLRPAGGRPSRFRAFAPTLVNILRVIKLASVYFIPYGLGLHLCAFFAACELLFGYSQLFFVAHAIVLGLVMGKYYYLD